MGIGVWGRAEVPWREARAWQHQGHRGWTRPFQLDKSSTVSRNSCRTGGCRGAHPWHSPSSCSKGPSVRCVAVSCTLLM